MMSKTPVAGVVWQTIQYLVGFERLGYETYYVEAHARTPTTLMTSEHDDSSLLAARFIDDACSAFGFGDRWAFHALHDDGCVYGLSQRALYELYRSAELLVNLHGATLLRPEHAAHDRLVYLETDPVEVQVQLANGTPGVVPFLRPHCAFFSFGENLAGPDCRLPRSETFDFRPTRQPVVLDFWAQPGETSANYTTIGNWRQSWRDVALDGETYTWSKHTEFLKVLDLPARSRASFELALAGIDDQDRELLVRHGWHVRAASTISSQIEPYRDYILGSRGEFTVAKDQNVRLRTGWFSDRSATYLAAGRPVVTQDTGFGCALPTGQGLFAFSSLDDAVAAVETIEADYDRHSRAARALAREYFAAESVLGRLLDDVGLPAFARDIVLVPVSRRPTRLADETLETVASTPLPRRRPASVPTASVIVTTFEGLPFTRLCLETLLTGAPETGLEVVVVDNASTDGTPAYLRRLAAVDDRVRLVLNEANIGFAAALNRGVAEARCSHLVLMNNDVIAPPRAIARLVRHLDDETIGLIGPVSNNAATEAQIAVDYTTLGGFLAAADERARAYAGCSRSMPMLTLFCVALRREAYDRIGPIDEAYGIGLFEDDDYSLRAERAGLRVACADDVLVHHFGEAAFGSLVPTGEYARLFQANRERFETKWGVRWQHHGPVPTDDYRRDVDAIRARIRAALPDRAQVLVVSRGDSTLLELEGICCSHFPQSPRGEYAGHYPADSASAIAHLESLRARGADYLVLPRTSLWWLDHYTEFGQHLDAHYGRVDETCCVIFKLEGRP
jgi:GT2 family glycosyltransferase